MNKKKILDVLSHILFYPGTDYKNHVQFCFDELKLSEEYKIIFEDFNTYVLQSTQSELEENFTYTFDMNPSHCLDIGWHLFGEDYKRGEFLVTMRNLIRKFNVQDTNELPDHLYHVLQVSNGMGEEERKLFLEEFLNPALNKILENMDEENNYFPVLKTLSSVLEFGKIVEQIQE